jgi:hypothetical protein
VVVVVVVVRKVAGEYRATVLSLRGSGEVNSAGGAGYLAQVGCCTVPIDRFSRSQYSRVIRLVELTRSGRALNRSDVQGAVCVEPHRPR